jgi:hypothetical protein
MLGRSRSVATFVTTVNTTVRNNKVHKYFYFYCFACCQECTGSLLRQSNLFSRISEVPTGSFGTKQHDGLEGNATADSSKPRKLTSTPTTALVVSRAFSQSVKMSRIVW